MQVPLHVAYEGKLDASPSLKQRIEREAERLERFGESITSCHVTIRGRSGNRRQGDLFDVRLRLAIPGRADVVVDRNPSADHAHEDPYVAIRDAFDAARRQLQDHARREDGAVKRHAAPPHGKVARIIADEGYGFIETPDGQDIYFHRNAVAHGGFDALTVGDEVAFVEVAGEKGSQASTVRKLGKTHILEGP